MEVLMAILIAVAVPPQGHGPASEVRTHADAILAKQLPDGAIVHTQKGDEIQISPYFGSYSALGLFEAYRVTADKKYLDGAVAWTDWYLEHMDVSGMVSDYKGTREKYSPIQTMDPTDSYPAIFLMCANVRRALTNDWRFVVREKPRLWKTYCVMMSTADVDGLTYARAGFPYKLTADNAEVYEALWHAKQLAHELRAYQWNEEIYYARRKIKKAFEGLRGPNGLYAWRMGSAAGTPTVETGDFYPVGLASLAAVEMGPVGVHKGAETVRRAYETYPDLDKCDADQLYWWIMAARRVHRNDIASKAIALMRTKVDERSLALDHALYICALTNWTRAEGMRPAKAHRPIMGSTFIDVPKQAFR